MQYIPTNDCFHHLINLLRLTGEKDLVIEIFKSQKMIVTKSKLKSWSIKTGDPKRDYREMPREALDAFIRGLYHYRLVDGDDEEGGDEDGDGED